MRMMMCQMRNYENDTRVNNAAEDSENDTSIAINKVSMKPRPAATNKVQPIRTPGNPNWQSRRIDTTGAQNNQNRASSYPPHWEINRYGKPFRCQKCGILGHRTESCRGNAQITCHACNQTGRLKFVCPNISKN